MSDNPPTSTPGAAAPAAPLSAIVLAAGQGTRMNSDLPKVLHEVAGRPMLGWVVDAAKQAGAEKVVVVIGYRGELVREALADEPGVVFVEQTERLGTGHAAMMAESASEGATCDVLVLCGDMPLIRTGILADLIATHRDRNAAATLATARLDDPSGYGRVLRDSSGGFDRIVEQKDATPEQLAVNEVNPSYYCFRAADLFAQLKNLRSDNAQGEYYLTDVPGMLKQQGETVALLDTVPAEDVLGINTLDDLAVVDRVMRKRLEATVR